MRVESITLRKEVWDEVGPEGNSLECPSCGETHLLTRDNCEFIDNEEASEEERS